VFLDRDGTLVDDTGYVHRPEQVHLLPGVSAALRQLRDAGFFLAVVANQSGVARGLFSEDDVHATHAHLLACLQADGAHIDRFLHCPHHPSQGIVSRYVVACDCRKPRPGLLQAVAESHGIDLTKSWMVGDRREDVLAGAAAGCRTIFLEPEPSVAGVEEETPRCVDLAAAAAYILAVSRGTPVPPIGGAHSILICLPSWVGDTVMTTPALRACRAAAPDARITLQGSESALATLREAGLHDAERPMFKGVRARVRAARALWNEHYDVAILFPNSVGAALTARLGGVSHLVGYDRDRRGFLLDTAVPPLRGTGTRNAKGFLAACMVDLYLHLVEAAGAPTVGRALQLGVGAEVVAHIDATLAATFDRASGPLIVINPGAAFGPSKRWGTARYGELASRLAANEPARVIVTGSPAEASEIEAVVTASGGRAQPLLRTGLDGLCGLAVRADLWIGNDSGARNIGVAFGVPTLTFVGPLHREWGTTDDPRETVLHETGLDCMPCGVQVCPIVGHPCMSGLDVSTALEAARELLEHGRSRPGPTVVRDVDGVLRPKVGN